MTPMTTVSDSSAMRERALVRELARRVRDIADEPVMAERRELWRRHNLLDPVRPMVLCFPEGAWRELIPDSELVCQDGRYRWIERQLRGQICWRDHINDDNTVEPWFDVNWKLVVGDYGFDIPYRRGEDRGSYVWDAPMKDLDGDFDKLHFRPLSVDRKLTAETLAFASELLGDLLPVRIHGSLFWTLGLTWEAAKLVGLENLMWAMCDQPQALHRIMRFLRDDAMNFITWLERERLLTPNTGPGDYVGSGGVGLLDDGLDGAIPARLEQLWGFGESQETVGISPVMFEEFVLPYQVPLLEKFRITSYGCCEGLEHRIGGILRDVPRLRRVSVAPNANQEKMAAALGRDYIFSRKPYPAHICVGFNEPAIRADLRHTLKLVGDHPLELILKDTHTVENDPSRITRWVKIAREEVDRHMAGKMAGEAMTSTRQEGSQPGDRLAGMDFAAHNAEVGALWAALDRRESPARVPIFVGTNSRYFIFNEAVNPDRIDFRSYTEDPDAMFDAQLHFQRWAKFNLLQDFELGLPKTWKIAPDFQNYYEAAWFGCEVEYLADQVPDTRPRFTENPEAVMEHGIPDPLGGVGAKALRYVEHYQRRAAREDFLGRPIEVGCPMCGTDGVMTVACNLFGPEFVCSAMIEEPDRLAKLFDFITEATIARMRAWRNLAGIPVPQDNFGWADDSVAMISTEAYRQHVMPHHRRLCAALATDSPRGIHLCGDATRLFPTLRDELNVWSFDTGFPVDFGKLRRELGPRARINGGPHVELLMSATPETVRREVRRILTSGVLEGGLFVLREGNNLAPRTPLENIEAMYRAGIEFGRLN